VGGRSSSRSRAKLLLDILRLWLENNSIISPDPVPQAPGFRDRFCVHSHDLFGCGKPKNSDLREATERNCSYPACSNQDRALSECICRLHRSASQTLASRKFNVFIDLLIRQVYRWC
jgi:hypothetical protein